MLASDSVEFADPSCSAYASSMAFRASRSQDAKACRRSLIQSAESGSVGVPSAHHHHLNLENPELASPFGIRRPEISCSRFLLPTRRHEFCHADGRTEQLRRAYPVGRLGCLWAQDFAWRESFHPVLNFTLPHCAKRNMEAEARHSHPSRYQVDFRQLHPCRRPQLHGQLR